MLLISIMCLYYVASNGEETALYISNIIRKYSQRNVQVPQKSLYHRSYLYKTVSETDNFVPKNKEDIKKIYYTVLNNGWDNFTFYCEENYTSCIEDVTAIADDKSDAYISLINNYVSPYNAYTKYNTLITGDYEINLSIQKLYTKEEIANIDMILDEIMNKYKINKDNYTIKDIEKLHDYLIKNIKYDEQYEKGDKTTISNKANGALINKKALCSGYTDSFALLLDRLNIPNFKITSDEHVWNAVYLNKKWVHIDVTWDDDEVNPNNNRNFFMITTKKLFELDKKEHNYNQNLYLELNYKIS